MEHSDLIRRAGLLSMADPFLLLLFRTLIVVALFGVLWMHIAASAVVAGVFLTAAVAITWVIARTARRQRPWSEIHSHGIDAFAIKMTCDRSLSILAAIAGLGCALRLLVWLLFPVELVSDHETYWMLANRLLTEGRYEAPEGRAFWPPGLPLVLVPFVAIFGSHALIAFNIAGYLALIAAIWGFGRHFFGPQVALIAAGIVSFWPNLVVLAPLATKEVVIAAGVPTLALWYALAHGSGRRPLAYAAAAGALGGLLALVQPSSLLLSLVVAAVEAWRSLETRRWWQGILRLAVFGIFMAAAIAPWTIRNYTVLGTFIPIGTAGGVNFLMVNSAGSDGRWNLPGHEMALLLSNDEVERSRKGFEAGWRYIEEQPRHFLVMALRKPLYMFGDDTKNIYWATNRGSSDGPVPVAPLMFTSLGYYFLILVAVTWWAWARSLSTQGTIAERLMLSFCLFPIPSHLFFEASERHRAGTIAFFSILAACGARSFLPLLADRLRRAS